jgi:integrase
MTSVKLTEKRIAQLRAPDPSGGQRLHWDDKLTGFGVLCSGVTNSKSYIVQKPLRGRTRRVTIGPTNVLTLEEARARARKVIADIYHGFDPKVKLRGGVTLRDALTEYLKTRTLRPRSAASYRDLTMAHLKPWLDRPLRDITRGMVEDQLKRIAAGVTRASKKRSGHATANGAMRTFKAIYNFAADRAPHANPLPPNPVKLKKKWLQVEPRSRVVKPAELPTFYAAVMELDNPVARDYIMLLLFTGMRRREAAGLKWVNIDLTEKIVRLPAAITKSGKPLDLPMSDIIYDLLVARRSLGDAIWVFPAPSKSGHIEEPKFPFAIVAKRTGIRVSAHDLRRTFITAAESCDLSHYALRALVNHSLGKSVTEGYIKMDADRLRAPAQRVADKLKELCGIAPVRGSTVVKLR